MKSTMLLLAAALMATACARSGQPESATTSIAPGIGAYGAITIPYTVAEAQDPLCADVSVGDRPAAYLCAGDVGFKIEAISGAAIDDQRLGVYFLPSTAGVPRVQDATAVAIQDHWLIVQSAASARVLVFVTIEGRDKVCDLSTLTAECATA